MIRPDRKLFVSSSFCAGIYRSPNFAYNWYLVPEGEPAKPRNGAARPVVWTRDGNDTFYVCPSCRGISRLSGEEYPLIINGPDLDANSCEVCSVCGIHAWYTFLDWTPRRYRGSIRMYPKKCPECRKPAHQHAPTVDYTFDGNRSVVHSRYVCGVCDIVWVTNTNVNTKEKRA